MKALARIGVLVEVRAVKVGEAVLVVWKMRGHPVEDDPQAALMQAVDEIHQVLRRAVARGRREIARDLVSPGAVKRMLHDWQELDVREAHVERVIPELLRHFPIRERAAVFLGNAAPGTQVYFVD